MRHKQDVYIYVLINAVKSTTDDQVLMTTMGSHS